MDIEKQLEPLREKYKKADRSVQKIIEIQVKLLKMGKERKYETVL